jgi:fatty-acyl-CoA synthase
MLLNAPGSADVDLHGLKMVVGGSALPRALARAAMDRGIDIFAGYGMSESGPFLTTAHVETRHLTGDMDEEITWRSKCGFPGPLVDLRVVDAEGQDVPRDGKATGEIVVRAPWLTMGYLNNQAASEQLWAGGYMHTGDVASIDVEGNLHVTDRLKDVIKSGGEWISSIELEDVVLQLEGVSRAAVIAVKDDKWGERPLVLVTVLPEYAATVDRDAIRAHVAAYALKGVISRFAVPERILFVDKLPLTSVGKIDKRMLRETHRDDLAKSGSELAFGAPRRS